MEADAFCVRQIGGVTMTLLENMPFDITKYCGNLIVTYLSDDKEKVSGLLKWLDESGYEYIENEVGLHSVLQSSYLVNMQNYLDDCGGFVLYVTDSFDDEKNQEFRNIIWYQIGYLECRQTELVIPFLAPGAKTDLSKTPIQRSNVITTLEEIDKTFSDKKGHVSVARNNFYEDAGLNVFTKDRIEYRRLLVSLDITEEDYTNALLLFCQKNGIVCSSAGAREKAEHKFINALRDYVSCGARVLSFGTIERLNTQLAPYADEMKTINMMDFPVDFSCSHMYRKAGEDEERKAEYLLEIILPIHRLLGVNFKMFVRGANKMGADVLKALFASNFTEANDVVIHNNAIYFSQDFQGAQPFAVDPELGLGSIADYLYPL